jgi:hypothetical protein
MTKYCFVLISLCTAGFSAPDTLRQSMDTDQTEPAYKVFYENGFYHEAIELLRTKIAERPDTVNSDYFTYLAFCYTASGQQDSAIDAFCTILDNDSAFFLDTITTSPKILHVFTDAQTQWSARRSSPDRSSLPVALLEPLPSKAANPVEVSVDTALGPSLGPELKTTGWRYFAFACIPGGAGQFYNHHPIRGSVLLALQAIGLAVGYWSYQKRGDYYDAQYGWGDWNRNEYEKYSDFSKAGFGVFITAYAFSVADCIIHIRKTRRR